MITPLASNDDSLGLDRDILERMLGIGGDDLRPALIAQLLQDFLRLRTALGAPEPQDARRAAHELKGLAATIGARLLAEEAARFDHLVPETTPSVRAAMVLGLARQIDSLCAVLGDRSGTASTTSAA